jgi:NADPH:quinone reductase
VLDRDHYERVEGYIRKGIEEGAELLAGGEGHPDGLEGGNYVKPTLLAATNDMTIAREEIFGPVLSLITYRDEGDVEHGRQVARQIRAGRVMVNEVIDARDAPFGGFKQSGMAREFGRYGIAAYLETQAVFTSEPPAQRSGASQERNVHVHAVIISQFGDPDVLTEVELPDPRPQAGQLSIDVTHAAVGMIDVIFRRGDLANDDRFPPPPFVPGIEVAGYVREVGDGVDQFRVGERVVTLSLVELGGYATVALADAARTVSLEGIDLDTAQAVAALPNAVTAHLALTHAVRIDGNKTVLVHGATGGLASAFPAVARALGARRLIGTVAEDAHIEASLALGYDAVILGASFPAALEGEKVGIVVDPVGGELRKPSLEVFAPQAQLLIMGHASGNPDEPFTGERPVAKEHRRDRLRRRHLPPGRPQPRPAGPRGRLALDRRTAPSESRCRRSSSRRQRSLTGTWKSARTRAG